MHSHDTTSPEEWRAVIGYEGWYSVSSLGRVRRDMGGTRTYAGRILTLGHANRGYRTVSLSRGSASSTRHATVHTLVAETFLGANPGGCVINHRNGVKGDNQPSNLEWVSPAENNAHAARFGLSPSGDRNGGRTHPENVRRGQKCNFSKLTENDIREIRRSSLLQDELATLYGVNQTAISKIRLRRRWAHVTD